MLKDHFSLEDGDLELIRKKEICEREQFEKQIKQRQFLKKEQNRARLFKKLIGDINAEFLEKTLTFNPNMEQNSYSALQAGVRREEETNVGNAVRANKQRTLEQGSESAEELELCPNYTRPPCSPLPLSSEPTGQSTASTCFGRNFDEEQIRASARHLKLYSYPFLVAEAKKVASLKTEREVNRIRPQHERRVFAQVERQRVRARREVLEDILISQRIKETAEKEFRSRTKANVDKLGEIPHEHIAESHFQYRQGGDQDTGSLTDDGSQVEEGESPSSSDSDEASLVSEEVLEMWQTLIRRMKIPLPTLCLCSRYFRSTETTPPWITCANNCPYFHRPEAYLKSLLDYIHSMD